LQLKAVAKILATTAWVVVLDAAHVYQNSHPTTSSFTFFMPQWVRSLPFVPRKEVW
jgi:hypothetical protein